MVTKHGQDAKAGPKRRVGILDFDYERIADSLGISQPQVRKDVNRGNLDISILKSLVLHFCWRCDKETRAEIYSALSRENVSVLALTSDMKERQKAFKDQQKEERDAKRP